MDISSASGPHSLDITFELAESRAGRRRECLQLCLFVFTNSAPGCSASSANNFKVGFHNSLSQNFKNQYILIEQILLNVKHVLKFYKWEGRKLLHYQRVYVDFYFISFRCTIILTWLWRMNASSFLKWFVLAASGAEGQGWINWYIRIMRSHQAPGSHSTGKCNSFVNLFNEIARQLNILIRVRCT